MIVKTSITFLLAASDEQLIATTQGVIAGLTGNTHFPSPVPPLPVLSGALDAFSVAVGEAANGGKELTAAKNAKRAALASLLRQLGSYITIQCDGDMEMLLSSQFPIQKPGRSPIGALPVPQAPALKQGANSGSVDAATGPVYGAGVYNWRVALASAPTTYIKTAQTTAARTSFEGLTAGEIYNVELNAVGAAGITDWSDDSTLRIL